MIDSRTAALASVNQAYKKKTEELIIDIMAGDKKLGAKEPDAKPDLRKAAQQALEAIEDLDGYRKDIDEAITTLRAALAQPDVPEGWVLVPVEPTLDMGWAYLNAARSQDPLREYVFNHDGYSAMLAAAPKGGA